MARILTNTELTHLTEPRLKALLKAARARACSLNAPCDCCGTPMMELYPSNYNADDRAQLASAWDYVERIKARLAVVQGHA